MFIDNAVVKKLEGEEGYDKFAIAAALFEVSFKGCACSLRVSKVLSSCEGCNLKHICQGIDAMVEDYIERTTVVTNSFRFDS